MTIQDIVGQFGDLKIYEKRVIEEDEAEIVVFNEDIQAWNDLFSKILGPAVKPFGVKPNAQHTTWAKPHGGIYDSQTMYKKDFEGYYVLVMFWPWGNMTQTTIKVALVNS